MPEKQFILMSSYSKRVLATLRLDEVRCKSENSRYELSYPDTGRQPWYISKAVYDAIKKWQADPDDNSNFVMDAYRLGDEDYVREVA